MSDKKSSEKDVSVTANSKETIKGNLNHPSRSLDARSHGFGVAAGWERAYNREEKPLEVTKDVYGPIPHGGYYGAGIGLRPFKKKEASFSEELSWYKAQYGEKTSHYEEVSKKK